MLSATKIRIYPNKAQADKLAKAFGSARWYWSNSLAETQKVYQETGKGLGRFQLNARLPQLKSAVPWLGETHSQVLQSVSLHRSRAFVNFFERRAKYPQFKSKHRKQSIQYPQGVKIVEDCNLARAISDASWGSFTHMLKYKTAKAGKSYIEVNRCFASSKTCSCCLHTQGQMPLEVRTWSCDQCGIKHDRDVNAAKNIRHEAQRMITAGIVVTAIGGAVSRGAERKSSIALAPLMLEAPSF